MGSRYKYILNDTGEVSCNTHWDKLPCKPEKSLFNQSALKSWVRPWILSPGTNINVRKNDSEQLKITRTVVKGRNPRVSCHLWIMRKCLRTSGK